MPKKHKVYIVLSNQLVVTNNYTQILGKKMKYVTVDARKVTDSICDLIKASKGRAFAKETIYCIYGKLPHPDEIAKKGREISTDTVQLIREKYDQGRVFVKQWIREEDLANQTSSM